MDTKTGIRKPNRPSHREDEVSAALRLRAPVCPKGLAAKSSIYGAEPAPIVSLLGAALGGGGGAFRSTKVYIPNVHAIAAAHPARMSEG
jgi:hypothetical protein